jgi:RecA-family ATPase
MSRPYPFQRAHDLEERPPDARWLVDELWADQAVGILGGEPKCCKSFLALELAVAVASGTPCLRYFPVRKRGRVLLYAAEDAHCVVRDRLEGICHASGVELEQLDILVITEPSIRLDLDDQAARLGETVEKCQPTLLVLDPFVRLHRADENASGEIAPILSYLRFLQQRHHTSVAVVHHARKGGSRRPGQGLRGSSEFHAWGDSNLYLQRLSDQLRLTTEHRAAAAVPPMQLRLVDNEVGAALEVVLEETHLRQQEQSLPSTSADRLIAVLEEATEPMTIEEIRKSTRLRKATVCEELAALVSSGKARRTNGTYSST